MKAATLLSTLFELASIASAAPLGQTASDNSTLIERQATVCPNGNGVGLVGNGSPKKMCLHKQLSEVISCGNAAGCSVDDSQTQAFTIGFSSTISGAEWIDGGFEVQEQWSTGNDYTCNGNSGETLCIWYNIAHTQYTVQSFEANACDPNDITVFDTYDLTSPHINNAGGGYYCVVGTCRSQGSEYWAAC